MISDDRLEVYARLVGDPHPRAFERLDERRVGLFRPRELQEARLRALLVDNINWTLAAFPTSGWAELVFGSRTSSACGTPSRPSSGSTSPIRSPRGAPTSTDSTPAPPRL